jgi:nitric oxide reductase subunit B
LHRWGLATAGMIYANDPSFSQTDLEALSRPEQALLKAQVSEQFKLNRYDADSDTLMLTAAQAQGLKQVFADYQTLLSQGSRVHSIPSGWFNNSEDIRDVTTFFAWTAWASAANRPQAPFSYTANWPHDDLIGNQVPGQFLVWSIVSVIVLIFAIAAFLFIYLTQAEADDVQVINERPALRLATPSQKVTSLSIQTGTPKGLPTVVEHN